MDSSSRPKSPPFTTALIVIFIGLICLPTLDTLFHLDHAPAPNENRSMARFPHFTRLKEVGSYIGGLEQYFNDHFGFRKRLIRLNNHWKHKLFGSADGNNVILGRRGWLFLNEHTIAEVTGQSRFTEKELSDWRKLLETRRDWLAKRGIKYIFVIPPDKHSVYPEDLPDWLVPGPLPSKVDQFVEYMGVHSTVPVLSLRPALVAAKKLHTTYLLTDTHWNAFGGYIGYEELLKALSPQMPKLKPWPIEAFDLKPVAAESGDLAILLGQEGSMPETQQWSLVPRPPLQRIKAEKNISRLFKKTSKEPDGELTLNSDGTGNALLFRDSFAGAWVGLLGQHFKEVDYIWRYDWDQVNLEREKPDVVIDEILERYFNYEDPVKLMKRDHLQ